MVSNTCDISNTGSHPWILPVFTTIEVGVKCQCLLFVSVWLIVNLTYSRDATMPLLETPSRVWRRIQDAQDVDMPSLPSLPAIDDVTEDLDSSFLPNDNGKRAQHDDLSLSLPVQPTPPLPSARHSQQPQPPPSRRVSAGQTSSILSHGPNKSTRSTATVRFADKHESFEISAAGTTTTSDFSGFYPHGGDADAGDFNSKDISGLALPDVDLSLGLDDALQPVSRPHSPLRRDSSSVGLRSDSRVCSSFICHMKDNGGRADATNRVGPYPSRLPHREPDELSASTP